MASIKTRLRVLRTEREWSHASFVNKIGASRAFMNAVEKGQYQPGLRLALKIARALPLRSLKLFKAGNFHKPQLRGA